MLELLIIEVLLLERLYFNSMYLNSKGYYFGSLMSIMTKIINKLDVNIYFFFITKIINSEKINRIYLAFMQLII